MTFDSSSLKPKGLENIFCSYPRLKLQFFSFIYLFSVDYISYIYIIYRKLYVESSDYIVHIKRCGSCLIDSKSIQKISIAGN